MRGNDRLADGKADANSCILGAEEAVEDMRQVRGGNARPIVKNGEDDRAFVIDRRLGIDPARRLSRLHDRLDAVDQQVDDHLLQLIRSPMTLGSPAPKVVDRTIDFEIDVMADEQECLLDDLVEVDEALLRFVLRCHAAYSMNDVTRATRVRHNSGGELRNFLGVVVSARQPSQAGLAVGHDGRKRLVDLMRDRRRQFSESCDTPGVREIGLHFSKLLLGVQPFADVLHGDEGVSSCSGGTGYVTVNRTSMIVAIESADPGFLNRDSGGLRNAQP